MRLDEEPRRRGIVTTETRRHGVEENYWHDNEWGQCLCEKCVEVKGRNLLGRLLMELREAFAAELP